MSVAIEQRMIPASNRNFPSSLLSDGNLWITVHETGNTNAGADEYGEAKFSVQQQGGPSSVAYHFAVGAKAAVQLLPLNRIGWHAGDGCNSRSTDVGCFSSIAIETVVGNNNRDKVKIRENLCKLIVAIVTGDTRINYGGTNHKRFSTQRIAPHKRWSSYSKDCPRYMLADGYFWTLVERTTKMLAPVVGIPSVPASGFASAVGITELDGYRHGDITKTPAHVLLPDGTLCVFVQNWVRATKATPRQRFSVGDEIIGPPLKPGEEFLVDWLMFNDAFEPTYYSPYQTRILEANTALVADVRESPVD